MIVVKLAPRGDVEFETREQLEEYLVHVQHEVETYAYLQEMPHRQHLSVAVQEWISEQYFRAQAALACATECSKDFDMLDMSRSYTHEG